jgi:hypothetical protein
MNCQLKASSRTIRQGLADRPRGAQTAARALTREINLSYPSMDLPNGKILGICEVSLGDAMP